MQISDVSCENHLAVYWKTLWAVVLLVNLLMMMIFDFKAHLWKDYCADHERYVKALSGLQEFLGFSSRGNGHTVLGCVFQVACMSGGEAVSISPMSISTCEPRGPNTENILDRQVQKVTTPPFSSSLSFIPSLVYSVTLCLSSLLRVIYTSCDVIGAVTRATPTHSFKNTKSDRDAALFSSLRE